MLRLQPNSDSRALTGSLSQKDLCLAKYKDFCGNDGINHSYTDQSQVTPKPEFRCIDSVCESAELGTQVK